MTPSAQDLLVNQALNSMRAAERAEDSLRGVETVLLEELKTTSPSTEAGQRLERFTLSIVRARRLLTQAAAAMPNEVWHEYLGTAPSASSVRPATAGRDLAPDGRAVKSPAPVLISQLFASHP